MFMAPMLLGKREEPFDDPDWIFEPKADGHRLILSHISGKTNLYTRHNNNCSAHYPELLHHVPADHDVVLDGEVVRIQDGHIDFDAVMERFRMTKQAKITLATKRQPVHYLAWDILHLDGRDLRGLDLMERKAILADVLDDNDFISKMPYTKEHGTALFRTIQEKGMEGIVAKKTGKPYDKTGARVDHWLKIKNYQYAEVYIGGMRKDQFGWLALVDTGNGQLRPAGVIELAVPAAHRKAFYGVSKAIRIGEDRNYVYVQPRIKARVRFLNWTKSGMLRLPEFVDFVV